jgi:hypothetical protein
MFSKIKDNRYPDVDGPFDRALNNAHDFAFNMLYMEALGESLRLTEIAQHNYNKAVENNNCEMITKTKMELDFCLKSLRFSSILSATNIDEHPL